MSAEAVVIDGRQIAKERIRVLTQRICELAASPGAARLALATLRVGASHDSVLYSKSIESLAAKIGVTYLAKEVPETATENELIREICLLNEDPAVTGVMIFSPLPKAVVKDRLLRQLDPAKDVESERLFVVSSDGPRVIPPTAAASMTLIAHCGVPLEGKDAVVIGRSNVVGKPVAMLLIEAHATVTVCHSRTSDLPARIRQADIVVATLGRPRFVRGDWIKKGAVVIDVGENMVDGRLVGDVDFNEAKKNASYISPVPGGVGPLTNVMLMENLLSLHRMRRKG